jgi:hypothetical protein
MIKGDPLKGAGRIRAGAYDGEKSLSPIRLTGRRDGVDSDEYQVGLMVYFEDLQFVVQG